MLNAWCDIVVPIYTLFVAAGIAGGSNAWACVVVALGFFLPARLNGIIDAVVPVYSGAAFVVAFCLATRCEKVVGEVAPPPPRVDGKPNLSGRWKMRSAENYEGYLAAVNVRPVMRKILVRSPVWQIIRDRGATIDISTKTRLMTIAHTYVIGGPPVRTKVRQQSFTDELAWNGDVLTLKKHNLNFGYDILVTRELLPDGHLKAQQIVSYPNRPKVTMTQIFARDP